MGLKLKEIFFCLKNVPFEQRAEQTGVLFMRITNGGLGAEPPAIGDYGRFRGRFL